MRWRCTGTWPRISAAQAIADLDALLPCVPEDAGEAECARSFIEGFGRRAYRRDLDPATVERLLAVYEVGRTDAAFADGIGLVIEAILQSPMFLYRIESGVPASGEDTVPLDGFEVASRLSYFLWRSMPDDELLSAAAAGELDGAEAIETQARRMLADPRAERALLTFTGELLALDELASIYKDSELFPDFSAELAADMRTELELFVLDGLRQGDARLATLLGDNHTFVNARLADFYGIDAPPGDDFVRVELDANEFRGILSKPVLMALDAHDQRTSPTLRGKLVRTRLFCQKMPPPPPGVNSTIPVPGTLSTKEWVQQRLDNPSCAACHQLMDSIGLGFERFDAVGRYREQEDGEAVDGVGELFGTDVDGEFTGAAGLADRLVASAEVGDCVAHEWLELGLGRTPTDDDECTVSDVGDEFAASDYDVVELLVAIARSDAFRTRRPEDSSGGTVTRRNTTRRWSRRELLRTLGVSAAAAPFIPMLDGHADDPDVPKRLVLFTHPDGLVLENWRPTGGEHDFVLSPILAPLEPHRDRLLVLDGVDSRLCDGHRQVQRGARRDGVAVDGDVADLAGRGHQRRVGFGPVGGPDRGRGNRGRDGVLVPAGRGDHRAQQRVRGDPGLPCRGPAAARLRERSPPGVRSPVRGLLRGFRGRCSDGLTAGAA